MQKWKLSGSGLVAAVVVGAIGFMLGPLRFGWTPTIVSAIVLTVLFVYDRTARRTLSESVAYAAVCGFLVVTALMYPLYVFVPEMTASPGDAFSSKPWLPVAWVVATIAVLAVDRMRANTRPVTVSLVSQPAPIAFSAAPVVTETVAAPPRPAPVTPEPERLAPVEAPAPEPIISAPPIAAPVVPPQPARSVAAPAVAVKPVPAPKGRPATIYLNLVGSGIACLRAVKAEYLGQDFYRIVEAIPAGEQWEFQTGQIVRCRKRTLSSGKAMVAVEEAPRAS